MRNEIIAAAVGGFFAWATTYAITHLMLQARLRRFLRVHINRKLWNLRQNAEWAREIRDTHAALGVIVHGAARHTSDDLSDLKETRDLALQYLSMDEIEKLCKFIFALWELECLFEGLCDAMTQLAVAGRPLSAEDVNYLRKKIDRITSLTDTVPREIKALKDLPGDYAGILGPRAVVVPPGALSLDPEVAAHR